MTAQVINMAAIRANAKRQQAASEAHTMLIRKLNLSIMKLKTMMEVFSRDEVRGWITPADLMSKYVPDSVNVAYEDVNKAFKKMDSDILPLMESRN